MKSKTLFSEFVLLLVILFFIFIFYLIGVKSRWRKTMVKKQTAQQAVAHDFVKKTCVHLETLTVPNDGIIILAKCQLTVSQS